MTVSAAFMYLSGICFTNFVAYFPAKKLEHHFVSKYGQIMSPAIPVTINEYIRVGMVAVDFNPWLWINESPKTDIMAIFPNVPSPIPMKLV